MKTMNSKNKKILIGILSIIVVAALVLMVFYLNRDQEIKFTKTNNKDIVLEYGQTYEVTFNDLVKVKDLSKEDIKELKKATKLKSTIKNEEGKEYPSVGEYEVSATYLKNTITKKVIVKDTTAPTFNETNEVSFEEGTTDYDFNQNVSALDLSPVTVEYDFEGLDTSKAGTYKIIATATDSNGNKTEKEITVTITPKAVAEPTPTDTTTGASLSGSSGKGIVYQGSGPVICIDAGHQGRGNNEKEPNGPGSSTMKAKVTSGATGTTTGVTEAQINLNVTIKLQKILSSKGYTVVMCRESQNVNISNVERAQIANEYNAAAFIRIHCDSSDSSSAIGTSTLAPTTSNPYCASIASKSQSLSRALLDSTCAITGSRSRGVITTDTMTGLNWSKVPVSIIEMGFLSNPSEDRLLASDDYQNKLATGIANGIDKFCGR